MSFVQNPTYFLAPNWTFRPGGKLNLGNIVSSELFIPACLATTADPRTFKVVNPLKPHIALTKADPDRPSPVEVAADRDWQIGLQKARNLSLGLWGVFVEKIYLALSLERESTRNSTYSMSSLHTVSYAEDPSNAEIQARCNAPEVREFMRLDSVLCKPVYMVTGVKVARDFKLEAAGAESQGVAVKAGAEAGPEASAGAGAAAKNAARWEHSFSSDNDIVFAYQLIRIKPEGWNPDNRKLGWTEFQHRKAFLSDDDKPSVEQGVRGEIEPVTSEDLGGMGSVAEVVEVEGAWVAIPALKK
ncbi:hypothetical protein PG991_010707 [Apiospora marii]|uniref:Uncharacterized protein n=1 Tax=Apiospora marii TaxID=335849 RepID=A0ABR1RC25_9PEZI